MIQRTFGVADGSCGMVRCKRESLIPNVAADEAVNADKGRNTAADKKLNAAADEAVNADKRRNAAANKQPNAAANEAVVLIRT